jgi:hypothetical protein
MSKHKPLNFQINGGATETWYFVVLVFAASLNFAMDARFPWLSICLQRYHKEFQNATEPIAFSLWKFYGTEMCETAAASS